MGGAQAGELPEGGLSPEELDKRFKAQQAENERRRQVAMNETPGTLAYPAMPGSQFSVNDAAGERQLEAWGKQPSVFDPMSLVFGDKGGSDKTAVEAREAFDRMLATKRRSVYGTLGIDINGLEYEVPLWNKGMTPTQAEDAARDRLELGLSPFATERELDRAIANNRVGF